MKKPMNKNKAHEAPRKKNQAFIYFACLGFLGVGFAYLRFKVFSFIWCLINLALIGGVGALLMLTPLKFFGFLVMFGASILLNIGVGLYYKFAPNAKDGSGELIL